MNVYLDYAATTPVDSRVLAAMMPYLGDEFANPSSLHQMGQRARRGVEQAREQVAAAIGANPREIVFCSGATEADNHALRAIAELHSGKHIITSKLEHSAVLTTCKYLEQRGYAVSYLEPDAGGVISAQAVKAALRPDTVLVALMLLNNETGIITDIPAISKLAHEAGALVFSDAVQALGSMPLDVNELGVDLLSLSAHKVYGPKGAGVLYVRPGLELPSLLLGGEQERGLRAGTLNTAAIAGIGMAAQLAQTELKTHAAELKALRDYFESMILELEGVSRNGAAEFRGPKHLNVMVAAADGEALLMGLDAFGVYASAGSACAAGTLEPSHVLLAMGLSAEQARSSLRFSFGRGLSREQLTYAAERFAEVVERCRRYS